MTDDTKQESETMTDDLPPLELEESTTHEKTVEKKFGQRGENVWKKTDEETDIDEMSTRKEVTFLTFCNCGTSITNADDLYRCCSCEDFTCENCRIELTRRTYCPDCIRGAYGVQRRVFYVLYLLDEGLLNPDELVGAEQADGIMNIQIDDTADALLENGFIRDPDDRDATALTDDDPLSTDGKQALHIGEKMYGDDPDVQDFKEKVAVRRAAEGGR